MGDSTNFRLRMLIGMMLAIITFAAFYQVLGHDFVNYDDDLCVYENQQVQQGFSPESIKWAFSSFHTGNWLPATWLSYMLDRHLYGPEAWGYHLTNLLIHIANVLLLFLVLQRMTGKPWRSAFVALLFGVHPLHVESVAWISERKDVLSTFFWLLTMWAYTSYVRHASVRRYLWVMLFFALGLMAKPMLVSLPFVLLLMDYWPLGRFSLGSDGNARVILRRLVCEKLPLLALVLASSVVAVVAQGAVGAVASAQLFGFGVRAANAAVSYVNYVAKTIRPVDLAIPYLHPGDTLPFLQVLGSVAGLVIVSALIFRNGRRWPPLAVGWLWYIVTLVPVIGLVQVGWQAMADRYSYVPLIGVFIAVAWGSPELCAYLGRKASRGSAKASDITSVLAKYAPAAAAIAVSAALVVCTHIQVGYWKDSITLFEHTLKVTGDNAIAHSNLGTAHFHLRQYEKAIPHYRKALSAQPGMTKVRFSLANALYATKRIDEAVEEYSEVLRLDPEFPDANNNLEVALSELTGDRQKGPSHDEKDPRHQEALQYFRRGSELNEQGDVDGAIRSFEEAIRIEPDLAEAHCNLGIALGRKGENERAIRECREAVRLKPEFTEAHINLALGLYVAGDYAGAWREVHLAQKRGGTLPPTFLESLSAKMPEPQE